MSKDNVFPGDIEAVCRLVLAAWEQLQPMFDTRFGSASFNETEYVVNEDEGLTCAKSVSQWAGGKPLTPLVWRAYWVARCHHNCLALSGAILAVLRELGKIGFATILTSNRETLHLQSAKLIEKAIIPHKVGRHKAGDIGGAVRIPAYDGDDEWHAFVGINNSAGIKFVIDISCAQFDVFGDEGQPYVVTPESEYFQIICQSVTELPAGASQFQHPIVQSKIDRIVKLLKPDLRKIAKGTPTDMKMISDKCPFDLIEAQVAQAKSTTQSCQTSTAEACAQQCAISADQLTSATDKEVVAAIRALIASNPESGWRKLLPIFKACHAHLSVSEKRFKALLREARSTDGQNAPDTPAVMKEDCPPQRLEQIAQVGTVAAARPLHGGQVVLDRGHVVRVIQVALDHAKELMELEQFQRAAHFFEKVLEMDPGNVTALGDLGHLTQMGQGVKQDTQKARQLWEKAASKGHALSQYNLGCMFMEGLVGHQDVTKAVGLWEKAAAGGEADAAQNLGTLYKQGRGVERNLSKACMYWERSAELGSAVGQFNLGVHYAAGEGVPKDLPKAVKFWEAAAAQGLAPAQNNLFSVYGHRGPTSLRNYSKAVHFLMKAVDQDDADALYEFGLHHMGPGPYQGIPHDPQKGWKIWEKAATLGSEKAIDACKTLYAEGSPSDRQRLRMVLPHVLK